MDGDRRPFVARCRAHPSRPGDRSLRLLTFAGILAGSLGGLACGEDSIPIASVEITPSEVVLSVGEREQLIAQPRDANDTAHNDRVVVWASEDAAIATVEQNGSVTGVSAGETTVTATSEGVTGRAVVRVRDPVASVSVFPGHVTMAVGTDVQLEARALSAEGSLLEDRVVTWSSEDESVATVDGGGLVTAASPGTSIVTATVEGVEGSATVVVAEPIPVLACGDYVAGSIDLAAEVDVYGFTTTVPDAFVLLSLAGTGGVVVDARVLDPAEAEIATFRASAARTIETATPGLHRVRITSATLRDAGSYRMGLECLDPLGPTEGTLASDDLIAEEIPLDGEVDLYTFTGEAGDVVLLPLAGTGGLVVDVTLLTPSRAVELTFRANSIARVTLPETGRYTLYAHTATLRGSGSYALGLESIRPLGPVQGALTPGAVISEAISTPGEVDLFTLSGNAGSTFLLTLANTSGIRVDAVVLAPDGEVVAVVGGNSAATVVLPETGTFVVYTYSAVGDATATYNISVN